MAFDKDAYRKWDSKAKKKVWEFLNNNGIHTVYKDEDYGADIVDHRGIAHEVEVKAVWSGQWNKNWKDVQIPHRKSKLLKRHSNIYFWVINRECNEAWLINGKNLTEENTRFIQAGRGNEKFFFIPIEKCTRVKLNKKYRDKK